MSGARRPALHRRARVLAVVPHYRCETWLGDCLDSLLAQSRPPDAVAVLDDASDPPPLGVVRQFPGVALLVAEANGGPYRLLQAVIERTGYDAYLLSDADDWSARERLEVLLDAAEASGAELVGSQEIRIFAAAADAIVARYPLDVNAALREQPGGFALLHASALIGRALVLQVGGFATGLRISGDLEFLHRAVHAARVMNVAEPLYFRRVRPDALTRAPETGLGSPARRRLHERLRRRAAANARRAAAGLPPDLRPLVVAAPLRLRRVHGPQLDAPRMTVASGAQA